MGYMNLSALNRLMNEATPYPAPIWLRMQNTERSFSGRLWKCRACGNCHQKKWKIDNVYEIMAKGMLFFTLLLH